MFSSLIREFTKPLIQEIYRAEPEITTRHQ